MSSSEPNTERINFTIRNISTDQQQTIISFRCLELCDEKQVEENYQKIVGTILGGRDVIVVTKEDQLKDLISDAVDEVDRSSVAAGALELMSFTPQPESNVKHHATLVKEVPLSVARDLSTSSEFIYGNLWFLIPKADVDGSRRDQLVIDDIRKLTPSAFSQPPVLQHEAIASPAMYDGLEILWFNAKENILVEQFGHLYKK